MTEQEWQKMIRDGKRAETLCTAEDLMDRDVFLRFGKDGVLSVHKLNIDEHCIYNTPIMEINLNDYIGNRLSIEEILAREA